MLQPSPLSTQFASPERSTPEELERQAHYFARVKNLSEFLNAVPNVFLVLNEHRQAVFSNQVLLDMLGLSDDRCIRGMRPGEILNCIHARENSAGCGTTEFCQTCGAVQTILDSLRGKSAVAECRIAQHGGDALDLRVSGVPFVADGQPFCLFAVEDISNEKRRTVLERLFFHDILNLAGVLLGYSQLLSDSFDDNSPATEMARTLYQATIRLIDEIKSQRELIAAESGDLSPRSSRLHSLPFLHNIRNFYQEHEAAAQRTLQIDPLAQDITFHSDPVLLERVLGNLTKNALEAADAGQAVTLSCCQEDERVAFTVHNPTVMPHNVQLQIFQRSFSTKGKGRGLGTYSVKLFAERYLGGAVTFSSSDAEGTTFKVLLPLQPVPAPDRAAR